MPINQLIDFQCIISNYKRPAVRLCYIGVRLRYIGKLIRNERFLHKTDKYVSKPVALIGPDGFVAWKCREQTPAPAQEAIPVKNIKLIINLC